MKLELDEKYHIAVKDKRGRIVGRKEEFETLEEVLGFLHRFDADEKSCRNMFVCLMNLRDGQCEVEIFRREFQIGRQTLKITPSKRFHELFWKGYGMG